MVCEEATAELCRRLRRPFLYPVFDPHLSLDSFEVLSARPGECKRDWLLDYLEALPPGTRDLDFEARLVQTAVSSIAERVTSGEIGRAEVARWARACSRMLCGYLGI